MSRSKRHFRELLTGSEEGIASNILADRLKRLVSSGLLTRDDPGRGRRATYSLTEPAIQLVPVFAALGSWGLRHRATTEPLRVRAELLDAGGPALSADLMDELRTLHLGAPSTGRASATARLTAEHARSASRAGTPAPSRAVGQTAAS